MMPTVSLKDGVVVDRSQYKKLTYQETCDKVKELQEQLDFYNKHLTHQLVPGFEYREVILTIGYLRNRARAIKKKKKVG